MTAPSHFSKIPNDLICHQILPFIPEFVSSGNFQWISNRWANQIFPTLLTLFWRNCFVTPSPVIKEHLSPSLDFQLYSTIDLQTKTLSHLRKINSGFSKSLCDLFNRYGVHINENRRFMPCAIIPSLQSQLEQQLDLALISCWSRIMPELTPDPSQPSSEASAAQIRDFLHHSPLIAQIEALDFSQLDLPCLPPEISLFYNLKKLNLDQNILTYLNLSQFQRLSWISAKNNSLETAILANLPSLRSAYLNGNQLCQVVLHKTPSLKRLHLHNNDLKTFPDEAFPRLEQLHLEHNCLESIDLKRCPAIRSVYLTGNYLEVLYLSDKEQLEKLSVGNNALEILELRNLPSLEIIHATDNPLLRELKAEGVPNINELDTTGCGSLSKLSREIRLTLGIKKKDRFATHVQVRTLEDATSE